VTVVVFDANGTLFGLDPSSSCALPPAPDAAEAVAAPGECAILTNSGRAAIEAMVSRAGLAIPVVLSCDEVRAFKPAAAPYLHARERLGDCVLVAGARVGRRRSAGRRAAGDLGRPLRARVAARRRCARRARREPRRGRRTSLELAPGAVEAAVRAVADGERQDAEDDDQDGDQGHVQMVPSSDYQHKWMYN
jgi:hypothetical protein